MKSLLLVSSDAARSAIAAAKVLGAVAIGAVLLYVVLILTRKIGVYLEHKKYLSYCQFYRQQHNTDEGMLQEADFVAQRAEGKVIVWKRNSAPTVAQPDAADTHSACDETPSSQTEECDAMEGTSATQSTTDNEVRSAPNMNDSDEDTADSAN